MSQNFSQFHIQEQTQEQVQTLSVQQLLAVQLMQLPTVALQERVENEIEENPWLEKADSAGENAEDALYDHDDYGDAPAESDDSTSDSDSPDEPEDYAEPEPSHNDYRREDDYSSEDDIPDYLLHPTPQRDEEAERIEWADSQSLYDKLKEQAGEFVLTPRQQLIMDYLIGSLEDSGLCTKSLATLVAEMELYQGVDATEAEVEQVLRILWQFDPPGIGARSVQECLLLQIARRTPGPRRDAMQRIIGKHYNDFIRNRWDVIARRLRLDATQLSGVRRELLRLSPRPGTPLSESVTMGEYHIVPDFVLEADPDGNVSFTLNEGDVPRLVVSAEALQKVKAYEAQGAKLSRAAMEDLNFTRQYVSRGQVFVNALKMRRNSMVRTMQAIIKMQHAYFVSGDESALVPMTLEDVAHLSGLSLSTVSRVCQHKYAQTPFGTVPMRWFFSGKAIVADGDEVSVRQVKAALRQLLDAEDKAHPLSDGKLAELLHSQNYQIARRTVAKYREQMGYPVIGLRKHRQ